MFIYLLLLVSFFFPRFLYFLTRLFLVRSCLYLDWVLCAALKFTSLCHILCHATCLKRHLICMQRELHIDRQVIVVWPLVTSITCWAIRTLGCLSMVGFLAGDMACLCRAAAAPRRIVRLYVAMNRLNAKWTIPHLCDILMDSFFPHSVRQFLFRAVILHKFFLVKCFQYCVPQSDFELRLRLYEGYNLWGGIQSSYLLLPLFLSQHIKLILHAGGEN